MDIEKDSDSLVINNFQFLIYHVYIQSPKTASLHFRQHLYDNAEGSENHILPSSLQSWSQRLPADYSAS